MSARDILLCAERVPLILNGIEDVFIRPLTAGDLYALMAQPGEQQGFLLVEASLVDAAGQEVLAAGEAKGMPVTVFRKVLEQVNALNGMDVESAEKN